MMVISLILATIAVLSYAADIPTQVHIALAGRNADTGDSSTMAVSWNTVSRTLTSKVKYGTKPGVYTEVASGSGSVYYETVNHHVVLNTLIPGTTYYYIVGDESAGWSNEFTFTSAPTNANLHGNFSFFVFGDLGFTNGDPTATYINENKDNVDLIWHTGDVSYADDAFLHLNCVLKFCYEETFDNYMKRIEPWASKVPYMVTPGNHEADCHDPACLTDRERRHKLSNFTAYNNRFHMPSAESGGVLNMHYSFNYGNVHFISLDTETGYPGAAEETRYVLPCGGFGDQLTWLEQDLIQANKERSLRPWIFVAGHHPMYQGSSINAEFQAAMEKLFFDYGVDVYFAGHVHHYERDYPVYAGQVDNAGYINPNYTTHVLIGGAGNDEMHQIQHNLFKDPSPQQTSSDDDGPWTVVTDVDDHVGIGKVTIVDDNTLKFEYIRTISGEIYDGYTLYRDHSKFLQK